MKLRRTLLTVLLAILPVYGKAQQACPCVPIAHEWIVSACDTWNCAVAAQVIAEGSPDVIAMPSGSDDFKWIVLRRVATGGAIVSPEGPFKIETFTNVGDGAVRFQAINPELRPLLLTVPDGNVLIVSRNTSQPRRRAAGR
jgi:hypothetical protein